MKSRPAPMSDKQKTSKRSVKSPPEKSAAAETSSVPAKTKRVKKSAAEAPPAPAEKKPEPAVPKTEVTAETLCPPHLHPPQKIRDPIHLARRRRAGTITAQRPR
ncbi:MAG: hypothetical protein WDN00_07480 [Limisphaerales bacterium]